VSLEYNDTSFGGHVNDANITFRFIDIEGQFQQDANGTYWVSIDTSQFAVGSHNLRIYATKSSYETKIITIFVTIKPLPTRLTLDASSSLSQDGFIGENVTFLFNYYDTYNEKPLENATVEASVGWEASECICQELDAGQYLVTVPLNYDIPGRYILSVKFTLENHQQGNNETTIIIKKTIAEIVFEQTRASIPRNDTGFVKFNVTLNGTDTLVPDLSYGLARWEDLSIDQEIQSLGNGSYLLEISGVARYISSIPIEAQIIFIDPKYSVLTTLFYLEIRPVHTRLEPSRIIIEDIIQSTNTSFTVRYLDIDHNLSISGVRPDIGSSGIEDYHWFYDETEGEYFFEFRTPVNVTERFDFNIRFSKEEYEEQVLQVTIITIENPVIKAVRDSAPIFGPILAIIALLAAAWIRHFSVPTLMRGVNRMIRSLQKGKIPEAEKVLSRAEILLKIVNEELEPVVIVKTLDDVVGETIVIEVPEVEDLLLRLAEITELGPEEIEAFRADLARMKPSERSGFLREVIEQEEARRAEALTEYEVEPEPVEKVVLEEEPSELEELKEGLLKKGMAMEEIEIILEQAKTLSKADLEALLDSLGISLD
jgi:hypothetical protein